MKRYLLFWFPQFYPSGGWNDLIGSFDTVELAFEEIIRLHRPEQRWFGDFQLIDVQTGEEVNTDEATMVYWQSRNK